MTSGETERGVRYSSVELDRVERRFWADAWASAPAEVAAEHGIRDRDFGPVRASILADLPKAGMMNLVLGAADPGAVTGSHLAAACEWARGQGVSPYVPVAPGGAEAAAAEEWLAANGFEPGYAWMKFVRDAHPPRFRRPAAEVVEVTSPEQEPFGMLVATGFAAPAWAAALFAQLPGREGWRCYVARVDGEAQACAAMLIDGGVAEFGLAATLEPARGRGCQLALLHQRILDANQAGCQLLFVETGERVPDRPSASYRNILRAGFEEAYLRPNWTPVRAPATA